MYPDDRLGGARLPLGRSDLRPEDLLFDAGSEAGSPYQLSIPEWIDASARAWWCNWWDSEGRHQFDEDGNLVGLGKIRA